MVRSIPRPKSQQLATSARGERRCSRAFQTAWREPKAPGRKIVTKGREGGRERESLLRGRGNKDKLTVASRKVLIAFGHRINPMRFDVVPSKRRTRPHLSSPRNHVRPSPISTPRHIRADVFHGKRGEGGGGTMTKLREQVLDERLGLESNELMADYFYPRPREMSTARLTTL